MEVYERTLWKAADLHQRAYDHNAWSGAAPDLPVEQLWPGLVQVSDEDQANLWGSMTTYGGNVRMPLIDIDIPHEWDGQTLRFSNNRGIGNRGYANMNRTFREVGVTMVPYDNDYRLRFAEPDEVRLVPSSTRGHAHLYVDVPMSKQQELDLLFELQRNNVVQRGFYEAARYYGMTFVRPRWAKKGANDF